MIKKYLLLCDMFGQTPGFYIRNDKLLKSYIGAIITLLIFIICITMGVLLGIEIFQKKNPKVNIFTESYEHPTKINYFDNFEVLISINNKNNFPEINEQIYYPKANLFKTIINSSGSYNEIFDIKLKRCNETMKSSSNYDLVKDLDLSNLYCLDNTNKDLIYLNDFWGNNNFQMIQIRLFSCKNETFNNSCKSEDEINTFLFNPTLQLYLIDININTNNYKNPFQKHLRDKFFYISNKYFFSITEYIHHVNMKTDKGVIFKLFNEKKNFTIDSIVERTVYNRNDTILSFNIQLINIIENYYRNYLKIQDLAAQIGGIYSILLLLCYFIINSISENIYFEYLINNFFDIIILNKKEYKNNLKNKKIKFQKINDVTTTETNNKIKGLIKYKNQQYDYQETISNFNDNIKSRKKNLLRKMPTSNTLTRANTITKSQKSYILKLNILDNFNLFCSKKKSLKKDKVKLFNIGKKHLKNYLEINNFINTYHNLNVYMDILFNESQQSILSFISEPILSLNFIGSRYNSKNIPKNIKKKLFKKII